MYQDVNLLLPSEADFFLEQDSCTNKIVLKNNSPSASTYKWDFGDSVTTSETDPQHHYLRPGNYNITLTVNAGTPCSNSKSQNVNFNYLENNPVYIPNSFTPNGDGINDEFKILT